MQSHAIEYHAQKSGVISETNRDVKHCQNSNNYAKRSLLWSGIRRPHVEVTHHSGAFLVIPETGFL